MEVIISNKGKGTTDEYLNKEAKRLKLKNFRGALMKDKLPKKPLLNECGIINMQTYKEDGSHWCCWWKKGNNKYYFDSYGLAPPTEIQKYLKPKITYSTFQIQNFNDNTCGEWCLHVLNELNKGKDFKDVVLDKVNKSTF